MTTVAIILNSTDKIHGVNKKIAFFINHLVLEAKTRNLMIKLAMVHQHKSKVYLLELRVSRNFDLI